MNIIRATGALSSKISRCAASTRRLAEVADALVSVGGFCAMAEQKAKPTSRRSEQRSFRTCDNSFLKESEQPAAML